MSESLPKLVVYPVTPDHWEDFLKLFGSHGEAAGCWCMWWRIKRKDFEANHREGNKIAMKEIVDSGKVPGLLAYHKNEPVGWVSIAPREDFPVLGRSPILKPVDELPVWSVVCFVIHRDYQRQGMSGYLLQAAVDYATSRGASIIEGYPVDPKASSSSEVYSFTGFLSTFQTAGFVEVARRTERKPIMRLHIKP